MPALSDDMQFVSLKRPTKPPRSSLQIPPQNLPAHVHSTVYLHKCMLHTQTPVDHQPHQQQPHQPQPPHHSHCHPRMSRGVSFKRSETVPVTTMDPDEFEAKARLLDTSSKDQLLGILQQLGQCFHRDRTNHGLVDVVKTTNFIGALATVMGENLQWAREEPKWIENIVDSIYYCMQWKIPLEQTKLLMDVAKKYLQEHESAFGITLLHRILTPIGNKLLVLHDFEVYHILKLIVIKGGTLKYNAIRCLQAAVLNSSEWQKKILNDPEFVEQLIDKQDETTWAFLSIVAQHFDAKLLFPSGVLEKAKLSAKIEHCINICAILCSETDAAELKLVLEYVNQRVQRLEELLAIQNKKGKTFPNSLLSLVLPFVNLSIPDQNKESLGEKLVSPLLRVLKINKDDHLILKIANCLERSKQEASRALFNLAFNAKNLDRIEAEGGMELLGKLATSEDSKVKRNATGIVYMFAQRANANAPAVPPPPPTATTGHVMVSYNWSNQPTIKRLTHDLVRQGYRIWVDYEQMEGSTLEAMARAVEGSCLFLMCFSQKYKDSPNCRLEGEYCMKRNINFIPLRLQKGYKPDGWLGIAVGNKLYHDFTNEDEWDSKLEKLLKEMNHTTNSTTTTTPRKAREASMDDFSVNESSQPIPHARRRASEKKLFKEPDLKPACSHEDVCSWMQSQGLEAHCDAFKKNRIGYKSLLELKELLKSTPELALALIGKILGNTDVVGDVLAVSAAVRNLQV